MTLSDSSRDTIGQNRTWILGRALGGVWFLTVGLLMLVVGLVLAVVYAVLEAVYTLLLDRPLNLARAWFHAPFVYGIMWGKYTLGMTSYPGLMPRASMGSRSRM
jgi:hypothetical protein